VEHAGQQQPLALAGLRDLDPTQPVPLYLVLEGPPAVEVLPPGLPLDHPTAVKRVAARLAEIADQQAALRPHLEARGIPVIAELSRLANVVQVLAPAEDGAVLARLPGVERVELVPIMKPALQSALPVVGAPEVWSQATPYHGDGITVAIVDTGIDYLHADFGGSGDINEYDNNDPALIESGSFPTTRVIGGWDFAGNDYDAGNSEKNEPVPDPDPLDCKHGHGSHVAGITGGNGVLLDGSVFAGPYDQSYDPAAFRLAPGVAPRVSFYAYKVFGCGGSTSLVALALERAADPDENGQFDDRVDVVNGSLGSSYGIKSSVNAQIIANLNAVGTLVVIAAGNEGRTFFITGTPGVYPEVLSVAASSDLDYITVRVEEPDSIAGDYPGSEGSFNTPLLQTGPITGELVPVVPADACADLENASELAGKIALIDRGTCYFVDKFERIEAAGAVAGIVIDNLLSDAPFTMGGGSASQTVPGVMIRRVHGDALKGALDEGVTIRLDGDDHFEGLGSESMTGFSSRGPSSADAILKPEIAAPGAAIDSASAGTGVEPRSSQGTSMACPVVAGAAALVRQAHPARGPSEIKALLMNGAEPIVDANDIPFPLSMQGAGRVNIPASVSRHVIVTNDLDDGTIALSFGGVVADAPLAESRTVVVQNFGTEPVTYGTSTSFTRVLPGVSMTIEPESFTVEGGATENLTVALHIDPDLLGVPDPDSFTPEVQYDLPRHYLTEASGHVHLVDQADGGGQTIALAFHAVPRAGTGRSAEGVHGCSPGQTTGTVSIALSGESAHPAPVVTVFELGATDEANPNGEDDPELAMLDLRAVGVATNFATASSFDEVSIHFGVAVEGEWTTLAQGPYSPIAVRIDTDLDPDFDYLVSAAPFTSWGPYADVLVATMSKVEPPYLVPVATRRFLNMVPANVAATYPFYNSVVVFSVFAKDIGLTEEMTTFRYNATSMGAQTFSPTEQTPWALFDIAKPRVDPARGAPTPGLPLYSGNEPIPVHLGEEALDGEPAEVLLLHHTNPQGHRFEVVDVSTFAGEQVTLSHSFPPELAPAARATGKVTVRNDAALPIEGAKLSFTLTGAQVTHVAPLKGSCVIGEDPPDEPPAGGLGGGGSAGGSATGGDPAGEEPAPVTECDLGTIAPGASIDVTVQLSTNADDDTATLTMSLTSESGCTTAYTDTMVFGSPSAEAGTLDVSGGCGCRAAGRDDGPSPWWLLALVAAGTRRRRSTA